MLWIRPGSRCVEFTATLEDTSTPMPAEAGATLYFKGSTVTGRLGTITDIEPLFSTHPEWDDSMITLLMDNLSVKAKGPPTSIGFFGFLWVDDEGEVGYGVAGVHELPSGLGAAASSSLR